MTVERWASLIQHVKEKVEDHYWKVDGLAEQYSDRELALCSDSDDGDDDEREESNSEADTDSDSASDSNDLMADDDDESSDDDIVTVD